MKTEKYENKYISILGDSISTFEGVSLPKDGVFYDLGRKLLSGVTTFSKTWWGIVLEGLKANLLVNNSVSESTVTWRDSYEVQSYGCSDQRTGSLDINGVKPDVIIVALGVNDWGLGVKILGGNENDFSAFSNAYNEMLRKLKTNYPLAEIWCLTLAKSFCSNTANFEFPLGKGGVHLEEYCKAIMKSAKENGCLAIDLYNNMNAYDTIDGFHPNATGMETIAKAILSRLENIEQ